MKVLTVILCLMLCLLAGCTEAEIAAIEGASATIDGKNYEVEITEATPEFNPASVPEDKENLPSVRNDTPYGITWDAPGSTNPPDVKYQLITDTGTVYLTNCVIYEAEGTVKIVNYSVRERYKEGDYWVYYEVSKTFDLNNVQVETIKL